MVRIKAKGVFKTKAHSIGRFTNSLALLIVMGRTPDCNPPRAPPTQKTTTSDSATKLMAKKCQRCFMVLKSK